MERFSRQRVLVLQFDLLPNSPLTCLARIFGIVHFIVPLWYVYIKNQLTEATVKELFGSQEAAIWFSRENFTPCLDRLVRLFDCSILKGELYFVSGSTCAII